MTLITEGPDWFAQTRQAAQERFVALGLPSDAQEIWRYSRIDDLDLDAYGVAEQPAPGGGVPPELADLLAVVAAGASGPLTVIVVRDGWPTLPDALPEGVTVSLPGSRRWPVVASAEDAFVALNGARGAAPLHLEIGRAASPAATIVVVHWAQRERVSSFPHLLVSLAPQSEARLVEIVASPDIDALVVPVTELDLAAGSRLAYTNLQLLGPRAWQVGMQASRVAADATLTSATVAFGGSYARTRIDAAAVGQGATCRLLAVWFGAGNQMHDLRTVQAHEAPRTTSELVFKGVVANQSHSVYSGVIRVEKGARGTNAMQTNRNLVLDEGAHADSVPNLEIEDNDVHCSHASAVGPIDDDQRFYLESRGVPTEVADRLIAQGFLDEVLERIPVPGLTGWLRGQVSAKLAEADAQR